MDKDLTTVLEIRKLIEGYDAVSQARILRYVLETIDWTDGQPMALGIAKASK